MDRVFVPRLHAILALSLFVSCGARSSLTAPEVDAGDAAAPDGSAGQRDCPFDCYVGHQCCVGNCDGPAVPMPNDCCTCLPGEVNTLVEGCPGDMCGG
jgi:hypothetical protein